MTWGFKLRRVAFVLMLLGVLALASGVNWVDYMSMFAFWW